MRDEFRVRAEEAREQASQTMLENVRVKLLRSADAWEAMAQREERVAAARAARAVEKTTVEVVVT
jgi:hypothetical protein